MPRLHSSYGMGLELVAYHFFLLTYKKGVAIGVIATPFLFGAIWKIALQVIG